jgi:hypothetical protein
LGSPKGELDFILKRPLEARFSSVFIGVHPWLNCIVPADEGSGSAFFEASMRFTEQFAPGDQSRVRNGSERFGKVRGTGGKRVWQGIANSKMVDPAAGGAKW